MTKALTFQPFLPLTWLIILLGLAALLVVIGLIMRRRGAWLRLLALGALALALLNPVMTEEQREPLKTTVGIVVDNSQSQKFGNRLNDTHQALASLQEVLKAYPQFEMRIIKTGALSSEFDSTETRLFSALNDGIADIPPAQYAGTVMITDGQVHDVPKDRASEPKAPLNALITGRPDEFDRQIKFVEPPRFGLTNKPLALSLLLEDKGHNPKPPSKVDVVVTVNGVRLGVYAFTPGQAQQIDVTLPHAGKNIIEASTLPVDGELTEVNNQTVAIIDAVRQNLRVLLVSGEPHNGERTWRDLLKSDASIDLVHFTILRPPEKADNTPLSQMSLIVFPTTELFVDKINDFDLVIFDRYQHYDVLPLIYYDYIAQYVQKGGALLMATGPEFAGENSLARTPLISALPVLPSGEVIEKPFRPALTKSGERHPVSRGLNTNSGKPEQWGRWMRQIAIKDTGKSTVVMNGADNKPLLLLDHVGKGRVGMLLSDEGWLWARGFEGGGPYAALYRRIAHWLMKEPELEEEALTATGANNLLTIRRQTMADQPEPVEVTLPSGKKQSLTLTKQQEGVFTGTIKTDEIGLFRITNGDQTVLAHVGPVNAPEFSELVSTSEKLSEPAKSSSGNVIRLHNTTNDSIQIPPIKVIKAGQKLSSNGHEIVLQQTNQTRLINTLQIPLFTGLWAMLTVMLLLAGMWYREGR